MSDKISVLAAEAISKGQAVQADGTVADATTDDIAGFAFDDCASGDYCTLVGPGGKIQAIATGSVGQGSLVVAGGEGRLAATGSLVAAGAGVVVAGRALENGTDGNFFYIQFDGFTTNS